MPLEQINSPGWTTTWGRMWMNRDRAQFEQQVYRCKRCSSLEERSVWRYGAPGPEFRALVLECGHFVKVGESLPVSA